MSWIQKRRSDNPTGKILESWDFRTHMFKDMFQRPVGVNLGLTQKQWNLNITNKVCYIPPWNNFWWVVFFWKGIVYWALVPRIEFKKKFCIHHLSSLRDATHMAYPSVLASPSHTMFKISASKNYHYISVTLDLDCNIAWLLNPLGTK